MKLFAKNITYYFLQNMKATETTLYSIQFLGRCLSAQPMNKLGNSKMNFCKIIMLLQWYSTVNEIYYHASFHSCKQTEYKFPINRTSNVHSMKRWRCSLCTRPACLIESL